MVYSIASQWKRATSSYFIRTLFLKNKKNSLFLGLNIVCNFIGALFEGSTYAFFLLALSAYDSTETSQVLQFFYQRGMQNDSIFILCVSLGISLLLLKYFFSYLALCSMNVLCYSLGTTLQYDTFSTILGYSFSEFLSKKHGSLLDIVRKPSSFMHGLMLTTNALITSTLIVGVFLSIMFSISASLTLVTFCFLGAIWICDKILLKSVLNASKKRTECSDEIASFSSQAFSGIRVVFLFSLFRYMKQKFLGIIERYYKNEQRLLSLQFFTRAKTEILGMSMIATCLILSRAISSGGMELPMLFSFLGIAYRMIASLNQTANNLNSFYTFMGDLHQIENVMSLAKRRNEHSVGTHVEQSIRKIHFSNVSFSYPGTEKKALNTLSLEVPEGKTVALVGHSGAGKSTFIDLLLGLYTPQSGDIRINEKRIQEYSLHVYRSHFGVVSQDTFLFHGSIRENILLDATNSTGEELLRICDVCQITPMLEKLPEGLETVIGERGYKLSGGEKQRIALARAMTRNADVLIFDEATSSLDNRTEKAIHAALMDMHGSKTIFIIAHRLTTISHADTIFVLENGSIVEKGTHKELLFAEGEYASLWKAHHTEKESAASLFV